jgi:hypothetical protein
MSSSAQETVVLRPSKLKFIGFLTGSLVLTGGGIGMIASGEGISGWFCAIFFALCSAVFVVLLLPGASYLRLTPEGFVVCSLYRVWPLIAWSGVSVFRVELMPPATRAVVFDQPGAADHLRLRRVNRAIAGGEGMLPDTYGMKAADLAALMNEWRNRRIGGAAANPLD